MPTLTEIAQETVRRHAGSLAEVMASQSALEARLKAMPRRKLTRWEKITNRVRYNVKAAVRWCTRWAWDGHCDCD